MASADAMRASDADREVVVAALQEQVGEGRLTLAEFEERSGQAYEAKTVGDLRALTKDLPVDPLAPPVMPWQQPLGMPVVPPWAQQGNYNPMFRRSLPPPTRRGGGAPVAAVAVIMLITLLVVQGVIVAASATAIVAPLFPLLILLFFILGGRRRRYR
jgi:hypothetical protein